MIICPHCGRPISPDCQTVLGPYGPTPHDRPDLARAAA